MSQIVVVIQEQRLNCNNKMTAEIMENPEFYSIEFSCIVQNVIA